MLPGLQEGFMDSLRGRWMRMLNDCLKTPLMAEELPAGRVLSGVFRK